MADMMQFDLVSPERKLASQEATSVQLPGAEGDLTAMPNHSALLTTLRPGIVSVQSGSDVVEYFVTGGFAEISEAGTSVLAEKAVVKADVTSDLIDEVLQTAEAALENADDDTRTLAALRVNDVKSLKEQLGL